MLHVIPASTATAEWSPRRLKTFKKLNDYIFKKSNDYAETKPHDNSTCVYKNLTDKMDDIRWLPSSFLVMKEDNIVLEQ